MHVDQLGTPASYDDLAPGALFWFGHRGRTHLGVKTIEAEGAQQGKPNFGCAVLAHPDHAGRPGFYYRNMVSDSPVLAVHEPRFILSSDPAEWALDQPPEIEPGHILVRADRTTLCVGSRTHDWLQVDVRTGEIVRGGRTMPMIVRRWSIVRLLFDKPIVLHECSVEPLLAMGGVRV